MVTLALARRVWAQWVGLKTVGWRSSGQPLARTSRARGPVTVSTVWPPVMSVTATCMAVERGFERVRLAGTEQKGV